MSLFTIAVRKGQELDFKNENINTVIVLQKKLLYRESDFLDVGLVVKKVCKETRYICSSADIQLTAYIYIRSWTLIVVGPSHQN